MAYVFLFNSRGNIDNRKRQLWKAIFKTCTKCTQFNNERTIDPTKDCVKGPGIFPKKAYTWSKRICKLIQHCLSLGKCKSKPQCDITSHL